MLLFYDTETTGLPDWKVPSESPHQPHIVQLAAALVEPDTLEVAASIDLIVRPDDWSIPDEVAAVHGITTEYASRVGIGEAEALSIFLALHEVATARVAYNAQFDDRIMRIAHFRYREYAAADAFRARPAICAMRAATAKVGLGKYPKLSEAHEALTGEPLVGAHSAMSDVLGTIRVYRVLRDLGAVPAAA
jgi:DNA polymerase III subunit epsilon